MLKLWPNDILTKSCAKVENFAYIPDLLDQMHSEMASLNGLGISAPQIGHELQIMLVKCKYEIVEIINPEIISKDGEQYEEEGCLSFPGVYTRIKRPLQVYFKCQNRNGEEKQYLAYGMEAVCFAHEYDHLSGVTILDHSNRQERKRILKALK